MSILSFVEPFESVMPVAEDALSLAALTLRTVGGIGALIAMIMLFRPLFIGVWHALIITVNPRQTLEQRIEQRRRQNVVALKQHADEKSKDQPELASELRHFASRD